LGDLEGDADFQAVAGKRDREQPLGALEADWRGRSAAQPARPADGEVIHVCLACVLGVAHSPRTACSCAETSDQSFGVLAAGHLISGPCWQRLLVPVRSWRRVRETASPATPADQLAKLADLRDRGVISAEEFEREKAKILA
jgi:Short C-terminal domain